MTDKEIVQRRAILKQQLTLIHLYPEEFLERLGTMGLERFVNEILDELNYLKKLSKKNKYE